MLTAGEFFRCMDFETQEVEEDPHLQCQLAVLNQALYHVVVGFA
jgi:hypothetical protein